MPFFKKLRSKLSGIKFTDEDAKKKIRKETNQKNPFTREGGEETVNDRKSDYQKSKELAERYNEAARKRRKK